MKDRFTREKARETIFERRTRQSRLITETVFCELKGQRDSINKTDVCYNFCSFRKHKIAPLGKHVVEQAYET